MIDLRTLIKAGVHFGHQRSRWNPKMRPYIWGQKNDVHLIDVSKTAHQLDRAAQFLESVAAAGKPILWVGTKKAAQEIVTRNAQQLQCPYVTHRWIGGILTNYPQVKKSVTKLLHYEDVLVKSEQFLYTKKELNKFEKLIERLKKNVGGIRHLTWPIGAIVLIDVKKEQAGLKEAFAAGVPVVGIVDTNSDPSGIDYVIPANDDAPRSIEVLVDYLSQATARGKALADQAAQRPQDEQAVDAQQFVEETLRVALGGEDEESEARRRNAARTTKKNTTTSRPRQRRPEINKVK